MKLLYLLLSISLFANAQTVKQVYTDSKEGVHTVYKDLKSTTPQIKSALEILSKDLKTTTDSLWEILLRQQLVWSLCFLILLLSSILNWYMFFKKNFNLKDDDFYIGKKELITKAGYSREEIITTDILIPKTDFPWIKYFHLIVCIALSSYSFYHFSDMMTGFINPEFGALKTITEVVKTINK